MWQDPEGLAGDFVRAHTSAVTRWASKEQHNRLDRWSQTNCSGFDAIKSCLPHARRQQMLRMHCVIICEWLKICVCVFDY